MSTIDRKTMRVAFQGEPGAFSEAAAIQLLGESITTVPRASFTRSTPYHNATPGRLAADLSKLCNPWLKPHP